MKWKAIKFRLSKIEHEVKFTNLLSMIADQDFYDTC